MFLSIQNSAQAAGGPDQVFIPLATTANTGSIGVSNDLSVEENEVIRLTNEQRAAAGCGPLAVSFKLMTAARDHTRDMAQHNQMSHTGSDGSTVVVRYERVGYLWRMAAENVAAGYPSPADVVDGWMHSSGHRSNILNCNITEIGVGYALTPSGDAAYWTQNFGTPQ